MSTPRTDSPAPAWLRLAAAVACFGAALPACEPMESRGNIFAPAQSLGSSPAGPPVPADPAFAFPTDAPLSLSSEELAAGDLPSALATAAGVDPTLLDAGTGPSLPEVESARPAPAAQAQPLTTPSLGVTIPSLPAAVQWPVRLVSTLPHAQPPRAILGLPSGEERVVSPGSMLADQGLVVMSVSGDRVTLARIAPAGDHARIDTVELTAQYPQ